MKDDKKLAALQKALKETQEKYPAFPENPVDFESPLHKIIYERIKELEKLQAKQEEETDSHYALSVAIAELNRVVAISNYKEEE